MVRIVIIGVACFVLGYVVRCSGEPDYMGLQREIVGLNEQIWRERVESGETVRYYLGLSDRVRELNGHIELLRDSLSAVRMEYTDIAARYYNEIKGRL